jgi:hypothetical protein
VSEEEAIFVNANPLLFIAHVKLLSISNALSYHCIASSYLPAAVAWPEIKKGYDITKNNYIVIEKEEARTGSVFCIFHDENYAKDHFLEYEIEATKTFEEKVNKRKSCLYFLLL